MKKILTITIASVVVAVLSLAATAGASADGAREPETTITAFLPGEPLAGVPATGSQFLTVDPLLDPHTREEIGTAVTRVVIAAAAEDDATFILDCAVQLPGGNLYFYGAETFASFADGVTYAVVGGTGRYEGTRGVVDINVTQIDGQPGSLLTFDLTRR